MDNVALSKAGLGLGMAPSYKRLLHLAGGTLGLLGVAFVAQRLLHYSDQIDLSEFGPAAWAIFGLLASAYGAANVFLALAWRKLLLSLGVSVTPEWAIRTYGLSQVGKYVPGNIFHLAGRQAMGMAAGIPSWPLAKSALWELGLIAAMGATFGLLALPALWSSLTPSLSILTFALALAASCIFLRIIGWNNIIVAAGWQTLFLSVSACVFVATLAVIGGSSPLRADAIVIGGAFIIAWLAGLLTPGAPAGLGVREAILLLLLEGLFDQQNILIAVIASRLVTATGDLFFFAASHAIVAPRAHKL